MLIKKLGIVKDTNGKKVFTPIAIDELDTNNTATIRVFDTDAMTCEDLPVIKADDGKLHRFNIVTISNNTFAKVREIKYTGYPDSNVTTMTLLERILVLSKVQKDIADLLSSDKDITLEKICSVIEPKAYGIIRNKSVGYVRMSSECVKAGFALLKEVLEKGVQLITTKEPQGDIAKSFITSKLNDDKIWVYKFDNMVAFEKFRPLPYTDKVESVGEPVELD